MPPILALLVLGLLAACGVDGVPQPPETPGLTISGSLRAGIVSQGH